MGLLGYTGDLILGRVVDGFYSLGFITPTRNDGPKIFELQ